MLISCAVDGDADASNDVDDPDSADDVDAGDVSDNAGSAGVDVSTGAGKDGNTFDNGLCVICLGGGTGSGSAGTPTVCVVCFGGGDDTDDTSDVSDPPEIFLNPERTDNGAENDGESENTLEEVGVGAWLCEMEKEVSLSDTDWDTVKGSMTTRFCMSLFSLGQPTTRLLLTICLEFM